jgi:methionyl-tRNA formyltransferase
MRAFLAARSAVRPSPPVRLYGLDCRPMVHTGWQIVLVSAVPIVAQTLAATLIELGHRLAAVISARRDRPMPGGPSMTDEAAPADLDLLLPASKQAIQPLVSAYEPDVLLCWGFPWRIPLDPVDASSPTGQP